jgi:hypothetical protein
VSSVNRRIIETIDESKFDDKIKELLKTLLMIELKNMADKSVRFSEDYDRSIKRLSRVEENQEDE